MKDYLNEPLSDEERAFVYGVIRKASLKFIREYTKVKDNEVLISDRRSVSEEEWADTTSYDFVDKILENKILRDISALKPYTKYEKEKIVETLEKIALESGLMRFITPLTFNEKLVVFLLYLENYQINEITILLQASRMAIWRRDKSIKKKIKIVKEKLKNG